MSFPTASTLDDFNRADGALGSAWSSPLVLGHSTPQIASNQVTGASGVSNSSYWNAGVFDAAQEAFMTISGSSATQLELYLRVNNPNTPTSRSGYLIRFDQFAEQIVVWRTINNSSTSIDTIALTLNQGDVCGARIYNSGNDIIIETYVNGALQKTTTDVGAVSTYPELADTGYIGFGLYGDGYTGIRALDTFGGGATAGGGGGGTPATNNNLPPTTLVSTSNLTGALTAIDDDPDTPDGTTLSASNTAANTEAVVSWGAITGGTLTGSQTFKAYVRKVGGTNTPTAHLDIYDGTTLLHTGTATNVSSGALLTETLDVTGTSLDGADGSTVRVHVVGTANVSGSTSKRSTTVPDAVEWDTQTYLSAALTASPVALASVSSLGSVVISVGGVDISLAALASAAALGTPSIHAAITAAVSGLSSASAVGTATATPGPVDVGLTGIASAGSFGSLVIVPGATSRAVIGLDSEGAFGTLVVLPGAVSQAVSALASAGLLGAVSVTQGAATAHPASLASSAALGAVVGIPGEVDVSVVALATEAAFGVPGASVGGPQPQILVVTAIGSAAAQGALTALPGAITEAVSGIASAGAFGTPTTETGATVIVASGLDSAGGFGSLTAEEQIDVLVSALASAGALGIPGTVVGPTTIAVAGLDSASLFVVPSFIGGVAPTFSPAVDGGAYFHHH